MNASLRILRKPTVLEREGCSNSTLYKNIERGLHTKPVRLGPNASGWPAHEIDALIAARLAGKTDDQIAALVTRLHLQREELYLELAGVA